MAGRMLAGFVDAGVLALALVFVLLNVGLAWTLAWSSTLHKVPGLAPDLLRLTSNYLMGRPNKKRDRSKAR